MVAGDFLGVVFNGIEDEDVDNVAGVIVVQGLLLVDAGGVERNIARHHVEVGFLHIGGAKHALGRQVGGILAHLFELEPVLVGHQDVEVVVPGNDPAMAHSADERAASEEIADAVLHADVMNLGAQAQKIRLLFVH